MELDSLGRYQILAEIGRGTGGVVYRAHDPVIDRSVAVKMIRLPDSISPKDRKAFLDRFFLEVRAAGRLNHPNIVVTHDAATDEPTGIPFIVMELVEGEPLDRKLSVKGKLPWREALEIVTELAKGLSHAHRADIVHRDIKPANVLFSSRGEPKIADFGIAKMPSAHLFQTGVVIGTPHFMSPEQIRGESVDGRSDLFSLGAVFYNLLVGTRPFEGPDAAAKSHQIQYKNPAPPSEREPEIPRTLDGVMGRLLAKSATERYASGMDLVEDLQAVTRGEEPHLAMKPAEKTAEAVASGITNVGQESPLLLLSTERRPRPLRRLLGWLALVALLTGAMVYSAGIDLTDVRRTLRPYVAPLSEMVATELDAVENRLQEKQAEWRRANQLRSEADALLETGHAQAQRGQWDQAQAAYEDSLQLYREAREGVGEASVLLARGRLAALQGKWSSAVTDLEASADVFGIYRNPDGKARALLAHGDLARDRDELAKAEALYREALFIADGLDDRGTTLEIFFATSKADLFGRSWEGAGEGFARVHTEATAESRWELAGRALQYLGAVAFVLGDGDVAAARWEEARETFDTTGSQARLAELGLWEGRALLLRGDATAAEKKINESERYYRASRNKPGLLAAAEASWELATIEKDQEGAERRGKEIADLRKELGLPPGPMLPNIREPSNPASRMTLLLRAAPITALREARLDAFEGEIPPVAARSTPDRP